MKPRFWLIILLALTVLRLIVAANVPLAPDEAYYWLWSRHLQPGYYDDAPLIAYWIRAGTTLLGNSALGIRLLSPLGAALGTLFLWRAGEDLFPARNAGLTAAILLNATLLLNVGAVITTPDTPLLLFWTATLAAVARWHATGNDRWWLAAGLAAGLALDAKYTGLLILVAIGLWLLLTPNGRAALRRPLPWLGAAIALVLFAPVILWNAHHGWVSFAKQGGRTTHFDLGGTALHLLGLIGSQIVLVTPGIILLMTIGVWRTLCACGVWRTLRDPAPAARLVALTVLVPGAIFLEHTLSGAVQPNWPAIMIPAAALAAAGAAPALTARFLRPAAALGFIMTIAVYAQAIAAPLPIAAHRDPTALQLAGWRALTTKITQIAQNHHITTIAATQYALVAQIAHDAPAAIAVAGIGPRWRYFGRPPLAADHRILLITPTDLPPPTATQFHHITRLGTLARRRGHTTIETYMIYTARLRRNQSAALMKAPR